LIGNLLAAFVVLRTYQRFKGLHRVADHIFQDLK
jgi:hypothetical protein